MRFWNKIKIYILQNARCIKMASVLRWMHQLGAKDMIVLHCLSAELCTHHCIWTSPSSASQGRPHLQNRNQVCAGVEPHCHLRQKSSRYSADRNPDTCYSVCTASEQKSSSLFSERFPLFHNKIIINSWVNVQTLYNLLITFLVIGAASMRPKHKREMHL